MRMCNNKLRKLIKGESRERERVESKWMMWLLMCLSRSVATINTMFQLLDIYSIDFLKSYSFLVQIFCLINCAPLHAPPIKFEQLASLIKWDNSDFNIHVTDVNVKIPFFFFFRSFYFFSLFLAFGFSFFSSPCGLS